MIDSSSIEDLITAMDVWHLSIPVVSRRDHGIGSVAGEIEIVIVRLTSSSGLEGFGEASPWPVFTGTAEANFAALDRYLLEPATQGWISDQARIHRERLGPLAGRFEDLSGSAKLRVLSILPMVHF